MKMKHYDIAAFNVDNDLQARLGFQKIYTIGKDVAVQATPKQNGMPIIIKSRDPGQLIRFLREPSVIGVIFEDNLLDKRVVERASESKKTIFIPISSLLWQDIWNRQKEIQKIRKILFTSHKLKAKAAIASFADTKESLLSKDQISEMANIITNTKGSKDKFLVGELHDN